MKIFNKIKIKYSFVLILLVNLLTNNFLSFLIAFVSFLLHELGHIFFIKLLKGKILSIEINAFGGIIKTNLENSYLVNMGRNISKCLDNSFYLQISI